MDTAAWPMAMLSAPAATLSVPVLLAWKYFVPLSLIFVTDELKEFRLLFVVLRPVLRLPTPLVAVVVVKVLAHWAMTGLPLLVVSPLAALLLGMAPHDAGVLALTLLLGTPTLSFLGAVGVGLTVGLRRGGVLLSLLVLPLSVPLLIFACGAIQAGAAGLPVDGYLAILAAFLAASATLCPFATAAALRLTVQ